METETNHKKKIILITGAPSAGKSSTLRQLPSLIKSNAVIVPESAVVLLAGGFPKPELEDMNQVRAFQKAIIQIQLGLEIVFDQQNPDKNWMILDRGVLDGAGFWPTGPDAFFQEFNILPAKEFKRYDFILFFELPKKEAFGGINNLRFHNYEQSLESEKRLKSVWSQHSAFIEIKATDTLDEKIDSATAMIKALMQL